MNDIAALRINPIISDNNEDGPLVAKRQIIIGGTQLLLMVCKTVPGYENPFWEVNDNNRIDNPIRNQTVSNVNGSEISTLTVISPSELTVTLTFDIQRSLTFPDELNGTYTCRVPNGTTSSSVVLTNSK